MVNSTTNELRNRCVTRIYTSADEKIVGAGWLVSDKYILTCAHVVADALKINHQTQDKPLDFIKLDFPILLGNNTQKFNAKVKEWKPLSGSNYSYGKDIAVLELLDQLSTNDVPFILSLAEVENHGFSVLGFPEKGDTGSITTGKFLGRVGDLGALVQMEVTSTHSCYIEPGFSGAPVWDEELASFVGIVQSSALVKYTDGKIGKPNEELRKNIKIAYMIPVTVLVDVWSDLHSLITPIEKTPENMSKEPERETTTDPEKQLYQELLKLKEEEYQAILRDIATTKTEEDRLFKIRRANQLAKDIKNLKSELD